MTKLVALGLLASAFAPVVAVVGIVQIPQLGWYAAIIIGSALAALLFLRLVLRSLTNVQRRPIVPKAVKRSDEKVLSFTASYVIPVIVAVFAEDDVVSLVGTGALIALLALIYVRGQLYHLNPTLALCGYRLYELTEENDTTTMLLTRRNHLPQTEVIHARYIGDDVAIQLGESR